MTSILTNNSAMVALKTLKGINNDLAKTQESISSGKKINSAKDNASIWSIAKTMESDVAGFKAVSDSLDLGKSTIAVARNGAESVRDMLSEMKQLIVTANEENVDRAKIQEDVSQLRDQIESVVNSAQFNGQNMLKNTDATAGEGTVDITSSLNRANGGVSAADISVSKADLSMEESTATTAGAAAAGVNLTAATIADGATGVVSDFTAADVEAGASFVVSGASMGDAAAADVSYVAREGDTITDVSRALAAELNFQNQAAGGSSADYSFSVSESGQLQMTNNSGSGFDTDLSGAIQNAAANTAASIGGGLELLNDYDVSTETGAAAALASIDNLLDTATAAAAEFGSAEKRVEIQSNFVGNLVDSMESGIGSLVDADMEQASAKLQALQVQQQLATQALSIANQAPQSILSLFR